MPARMARRKSWVRRLVMGLGVPELIVVAAVLLVPFWKIFSKAGFHGALSLLMIVPVVNLVMLYVLAFSQWPALRGVEKVPGS
jgi:hypothetical protein